MANPSRSGRTLSLKSLEGIRALLALPGIGETIAVRIAEEFDTWHDAAAAPEAALRKLATAATRIHGTPPLWEYSVFDAGFPEAVKELGDATATLTTWGDLPAGRRIAIIGTRAPDDTGRKAARRVATMAASKGWVVVSGMAIGIDREAHHAAMEAGGTTVAIVGSSLNAVKKDDWPFVSTIVSSRGCVWSCEPLLSTPNVNGAPLKRNRVVTGISDLVYVAQASDKGGTLNAVGWALRQGKMVAVEPPSMHAADWAGNARLLDPDCDQKWIDGQLGKGTLKSSGVPLAEAWSDSLLD